MFGLKEEDIVEIKVLLQGFPEVEQAVIFGSRAKGNHRHGSDVDIALKGADFRTASKIAGILNEETLMPYHFDVVSYHDLKNKGLQDHIDRVGKSVYQTEYSTSLNERSIEYKKDENEK